MWSIRRLIRDTVKTIEGRWAEDTEALVTLWTQQASHSLPGWPRRRLFNPNYHRASQNHRLTKNLKTQLMSGPPVKTGRPLFTGPRFVLCGYNILWEFDRVREWEREWDRENEWIKSIRTRGLKGSVVEGPDWGVINANAVLHSVNRGSKD